MRRSIALDTLSSWVYPNKGPESRFAASSLQGSYRVQRSRFECRKTTWNGLRPSYFNSSYSSQLYVSHGRIYRKDSSDEEGMSGNRINLFPQQMSPSRPRTARYTDNHGPQDSSKGGKVPRLSSP